MARRRRSTRPRRFAAALAAALLALPALAAAAAPPGGDSPQAVVARLNAAAADKDFAEMVACMAPAARREMAAGLLIGSTMILAFMDMGAEMATGLAEGMAEGMVEGMTGEEMPAAQKKAKEEAKKASAALKERYDGILEKHGLAERMEAGPGAAGAEDPEQAMAALLTGVDESALIADLMAFFESLPDDDGKKAMQPMELPTEVTDYVIAGDRATAKSGDETLQFVRIDGRWYMEPTPKGDEAEN